MFTYKLLRIAALLLIVAGLSGVVPLSYFWVTSKVAVAQQSSAAVVQSPAPKPLPTLVMGEPVAIAIPSLNLNLGVIPGIYNPRTGAWNLTLSEAQFATTSVEPNNESGQTFIYGHYRPAVFAYLHHILPGAQAIITTANGYTFTYTYQSSQAFEPTDTSILIYQGPPRLVIQTCSGAFMQNRQMYYFAYDGYQPV
jgi:sortase (surface protein transpeptidase)